MKSIAAVTMVKNEKNMLPLWMNYYASNFGKKNLFIVDHATTDGSTDDLQCGGVVKLTDEEMDEFKRSKFISLFCASLLCYYDVVVFTDCDEFLVVDPDNCDNLYDYCQGINDDYTAAIGLNIVHDREIEGPIDFNKHILSQRSYAYLTSNMFKTLIIKKEISWGPGFHSQHKRAFLDGSLYNFHLKYFDFNYLVDRYKFLQQISISDASKRSRHDIHWQRSVNDLSSFLSNIFKFKNDKNVNNFNFSSEVGFFNTSPAVNGVFNSKRSEIKSRLVKIPQKFQKIF